MKSKTYFHGDGGKWGIWDSVMKAFRFGVCEDSPFKAEKKLIEKIGAGAFKFRFQARQMPRKEAADGRSD